MNPAELLAKTIVDVGWAKPSELAGCSNAEISTLENRRALQLPESYKQFLRVIGHGAGQFNSDAFWTYDTLEDAQTRAIEMLHKNNISVPETLFAFDTGDGNFLFFETAEGDDPSVMLYESGDPSTRKLADSFSLWLSKHANGIVKRHEKSLQMKKEMEAKGIKPGRIHGPN